MKKALMVTGGQVDLDHLKKEYNQCSFDFILGVDSGCNSLYYLNILPNGIIGDFDSIDESILDNLKSTNCEIITHYKKKNYTDTELAINFLIDRGFGSVIIFGATGSRIDHMFSTILVMNYYNRFIEITIQDSKNHITFLKGPVSCKIEKEEYAYFSLLALSEIVTGITYTNAKYPLHNATISQYQSIGISNEWIDSDVLLDISSGEALLIKTKD